MCVYSTCMFMCMYACVCVYMHVNGGYVQCVACICVCPCEWCMCMLCVVCYVCMCIKSLHACLYTHYMYVHGTFKCTQMEHLKQPCFKSLCFRVASPAKMKQWEGKGLTAEFPLRS